MSRLRITKSKMFAMEMVKACLRHHSVPREFRLDGLWMEMSMEDESGTMGSVLMLIKIHGASSRVQASFSLGRPEAKGDWEYGTCTITLPDAPTRSWTFQGRIENGIFVPELIGEEDLTVPEYTFLKPAASPSQHD